MTTPVPTLKQQMEAIWREPGCQSPLRPARWVVVHGVLQPDDDPFVPDEDDDITDL